MSVSEGNADIAKSSVLRMLTKPDASAHHHHYCLRCPSGKSRHRSVQPLPRKYSCFQPTQISAITAAVSSLLRGAYRDRHERWGGMRWTRQRRARTRSQGGLRPVSDQRAPDERRLSPAKPFGEDGWLRTAKPCGSGTRCWCQAVGGEMIRPDQMAIKPAATVTRRIRRRGEHGISRKAIAQGMPECLR
jgi:hypothetical protein